MQTEIKHSSGFMISWRADGANLYEYSMEGPDGFTHSDDTSQTGLDVSALLNRPGSYTITVVARNDSDEAQPVTARFTVSPDGITEFQVVTDEEAGSTQTEQEDVPLDVPVTPLPRTQQTPPPARRPSANRDPHSSDDISRITEEMCSGFNRLDRTIGSLGDTVAGAVGSSLKGILGNILNKQDDLATSMSRTQSNQNSMATAMEKLGKAMEAIDSRNVQLGTAVTGLDGKVTALATEVAGLKNGLATVTTKVGTMETSVTNLANRPGQGPKERWAMLGMLTFLCIMVPLCAWLITKHKDANPLPGVGTSQNSGQGSGQSGGPGQQSGQIEHVSAAPPPINMVPQGITNVMNNCNNAVLIVTNVYYQCQPPAAASTAPPPAPAPAPTTAVPATPEPPPQQTTYLQIPTPTIPMVVTGPGVYYSGVTFETTVLPGPVIPIFEHRRSGFNFGVWRHQKEVWRPVPCPPQPRHR